MTIFKIDGKLSKGTLHLEHPLNIDDRCYESGVIAFRYPYCKKNPGFEVESDSKMTFGETKNELLFPKGFYSLNDINKKISKFIKPLNYYFEIQLYDNKTIEISSDINFTMDKDLCKSLGFIHKKEFMPFASSRIKGSITNNFSVSLLTPAPITTEIHCNIVESSISSHNIHTHKHKEDLIYVFSYDSNKTIEKPTNILYIPLRRGLKQLSTIDINLLDYNGKKYKGFDEFTLYLHLKKLKLDEDHKVLIRM